VAIKQLIDDQNISEEESKLRFEQEISIIWGISSHPNTLTLVGYSENPPSIITKVFSFFFSFSFLFLFLLLLLLLLFVFLEEFFSFVVIR